MKNLAGTKLLALGTVTAFAGGTGTEEAGEETRVCSRDPSHLEVRAIPATTGTAPKPETDPAKPAAEPEKSNTGVIIAVVAAAVVVAGGGIAVIVLIKKKKAS